MPNHRLTLTPQPDGAYTVQLDGVDVSTAVAAVDVTVGHDGGRVQATAVLTLVGLDAAAVTDGGPVVVNDDAVYLLERLGWTPPPPSWQPPADPPTVGAVLSSADVAHLSTRRPPGTPG